VEEIVDRENPLLDLELDPKLSWALRNLHIFPVNINTADYHLIMRVPGIGVQSAQKICAARKYANLSAENLKKLGIAYNRAKHFIVCRGAFTHQDVEQYKLRQIILKEMRSKYKPNFSTQMTLF
jgi:predicted DNA-binding helix-hairpin-helix protein